MSRCTTPVSKTVSPAEVRAILVSKSSLKKQDSYRCPVSVSLKDSEDDRKERKL